MSLPPGATRNPVAPCSQACGLGEIDAEPVAPALVAAGHLGAGVAELLLDVALVDLGGGGEAGAQRMSGEFLLPLRLRRDRRGRRRRAPFA